MITARTGSVEDTRALAGALAELVRPGDVLLLAGDLGAGKTAFVQGFGRALGVTEPITSPTFTLVRDYNGRLPMHHIDVYRLDSLQEVIDIGLSELVDDGAVTLIEWGDAVVPIVPADFLEVRLNYGEGDSERLLALRPVGPSWSARSAILWKSLDPWSGGH